MGTNQKRDKEKRMEDVDVEPPVSFNTIVDNRSCGNHHRHEDSGNSCRLKDKRS